jgi:hypothetical protein
MRGAFDFETWEWVNPLCCGFTWDDNRCEDWVHDESQKQPDTVAEDALKFMHAHPEVTEWWGHNAGRFDCLFLAAAAVRMGWKVKGMLAGGGRVIGMEFTPPKSKRKVRTFDTANMVERHEREKTYHGEDKPVRVFDSFNVAPSSLKDCAEDFELPSRKQFTESNYKGDMRSLSVKALRDGCLADCRIVLELLNKVETYVEDWGGELRKTFSSSAFTIVKSHLESKGLEIQQLSPKLNKLCSESFLGARVEVFQHMPTGLVDEYDINSSYPFAMAQPLPWEFREHTKKEGRVIAALECGEAALIRARVDVPEMDIPPLPYRLPDNDDSGIFFPTGSWEAWFTQPELEYAMSCGVSVQPFRALLFTKRNPFVDFIDELYKTKRSAKGALRNFTKLCLNGSFGKWAQGPEHENLLVFGSDIEANQFAGEHPNQCTYLWPEDERFLAYEYEKWSKHTHYGIASYITARARIALHRFISESRSPAYCDSDSIHCEAWEGNPNADLGGLKLERSRVRGEYFAPKIYRLSKPSGELEHMACKGFPVKAEEFQKMLDSAEDYHAGITPTKRRGVKVEGMRLIKSQLRSKGTQGSVERVSVVKRWRGMSMKRFPYPDGSTRAWTVDELSEGLHRKAVSPAISKLTNRK